MFGFNWIDVLIVGLIVGAVFVGKKIGFLIQLCLVAGFFVGLFVAGWFFPHILPFHDQTVRTLLNANLVLITAAYTALRGFDLGHKLHWSLRKKYRGLEAGFGIGISIVTVLVIAWLLAALIGRLPFAGLSNSVSDARIILILDRVLPPIPAVLNEFGRVTKQNNQPYLFVQPKPQSSFLFSESDIQAASAKATNSVVRITSFGCGGLAEGSGFAVDHELVATNAHVIAGVKRPIIKYHNSSYEGIPVLFDPNLDLAILRVKGLAAAPLKLAKQNSPLNTSVAVLGYPGGNYEISPGLIRNDLDVFGRNIYGVGVINRNIYEIQTHVDHGSSGGPVVLPDGRVVGIVFAKYDAPADYAYALTSSHILDKITQAAKTDQRVNTGVCMAD